MIEHVRYGHFDVVCLHSWLSVLLITNSNVLSSSNYKTTVVCVTWCFSVFDNTCFADYHPSKVSEALLKHRKLGLNSIRQVVAKVGWLTWKMKLCKCCFIDTMTSPKWWFALIIGKNFEIALFFKQFFSVVSNFIQNIWYLLVYFTQQKFLFHLILDRLFAAVLVIATFVYIQQCPNGIYTKISDNNQ